MPSAVNTQTTVLAGNLGGAYPDKLQVNNPVFVLGTPTDLAALGSTQANAALVTATVTNATAADGTKGIILPALTAGATYYIYNSVATNGLKIYPPTGAAFNGGSANAAITIEGKTAAILVAMSTTNVAATFTADS